MPLAWDEATMGTGFPDIDAQHRELIRHLGLFLEAMKDGRSREELAELVAFLGNYARSHFAHEEQCMNRLHCPVAKANETAHRQFERVFELIARELEAEGPKASLAIRAQRELSDWVREHIVRIDTRLRACVPAGGA